LAITVPPSLHAFIAFPSSIAYSVWLMTAARTITNEQQLSRNFETGSPEFDSRYVFSSSEPERFIRMVVESSAVRDASKAVFEDRDVPLLVQEIGFLHGMAVRDLEAELSSEYVHVILNAMGVLAQASETM
jgi:hypothetical protein